MVARIVRRDTCSRTQGRTCLEEILGGSDPPKIIQKLSKNYPQNILKNENILKHSYFYE